MKTNMKSIFFILIVLLYTNASHSAEGKKTRSNQVEQDHEEILKTQTMMPLSVRDAMEQLKVTEGTKDELSILGQDEDTGLSSSYNLKNDNLKLGFGYHIAANPREASQIAALDFTLGGKFWPKTWIMGFLQTGKMQFSQITEQNQSRSISSSDAEELDSTSETVLATGLGLSYETTYIQDFIGYDKVFDSISAYLSYLRMHESFANENYTGPGIRADYGVHYRLSSATHLGLNFSYNIYSVKRPEAFVDEPQFQRHLSIAWLSWAFNFTVYF